MSIKKMIVCIYWPLLF